MRIPKRYRWSVVLSRRARPVSWYREQNICEQGSAQGGQGSSSFLHPDWTGKGQVRHRFVDAGDSGGLWQISSYKASEVPPPPPPQYWLWCVFRPICLPDPEDEALDLAGLDKTGITVGWGITKILRYERTQCDYVKGMYNTSAVSHKLKKINLKWEQGCERDLSTERV